MKRFLSSLLACLLLFACIYATPVTVHAQLNGSPTNNIVNTWTGTPGDLYQYHTHTTGPGIPIFVMPVHFGPADLASGGKLQTASKWAADVVLDAAAEFWEDLADYFDIYVYIQSEDVYPVPASGYVSSWSEKMTLARTLTRDLLGKDPVQTRMVYLGNCDNESLTVGKAGQVGGHAYFADGAMLAWGKDTDGNPWQDNPPYWARHEFFGHGYAMLLDEYEADLSIYNRSGPNIVESTTKPTNGVPWYEFLGYKETFNSVEYEIGIYTHANADYRWWFPLDAGFMHSSNPYISMYHKWVIYKLTMEYAGTPKTLAEFCTMQGIVLNPPAPDTPLDAFLIAAQQGGTYQMQGDISLTAELAVQNDFALDLNGHTLTINVNSKRGAGIAIGTGRTLTIDDTAGGGALNVTSTTGAGINTNGATLVVNGGTLDITGGDWSAGIGGLKNSNGTVVINGGTVTATGHTNSAGIGGGSGGGCGSITINGGTVTATGTGPSDIGFGAGGGLAGGVVINGGTVNATRQLISPAPTNGSTPVYLAALTLTGVPNTKVTALTSPATYGGEDLYTDANSKVYLWLPQGAQTVALAAGGTSYSGTVTVTSNNTATATLNPSGNLPLSIVSHPSNLTVADGKKAVFTVSAVGYPTPTYQWQISTDNGSSWTNISGATTHTLTLTNVTIDEHNGNRYRCLVKNNTKELTSNAAKLTVEDGFGPNPGTGTADVVPLMVALCGFLLISAALWGYIIHKRRKTKVK